MRTVHQITEDAKLKYPELEPFSNILIKEPKIMPGITIDTMLAIANLLNKQYGELEQLCMGNDMLYEELEEEIGTSQSEMITTMAFSFGLTEPVQLPDYKS